MQSVCKPIIKLLKTMLSVGFFLTPVSSLAQEFKCSYFLSKARSTELMLRPQNQEGIFSYAENFENEGRVTHKKVSLNDLFHILTKEELAANWFQGEAPEGYAEVGLVLSAEKRDSFSIVWSQLLHTTSLYEVNGKSMPVYSRSAHRVSAPMAKIVYDSHSIVRAKEKEPGFNLKLVPRHEDLRYPGFSTLSAERRRDPLLTAESIAEAQAANPLGLDLYVQGSVSNRHIQKIYIPAGYERAFFEKLEAADVTQIEGRPLHDIVEVVHPSKQELIYIPPPGTYTFDFFLLADPFASSLTKVAVSGWEIGGRELLMNMLKTYRDVYGIDFSLSEEKIRTRAEQSVAKLKEARSGRKR